MHQSYRIGQGKSAAGEGLKKMDAAFLPAYVLARAVRRRERSPVELVRAALERIEALNPTLNAFVALRAEGALAEAAALERRIAAGEDVGPLAGLPVGVKDLEDVADMPTTFGSVPLQELATARRLGAGGAPEARRARSSSARPTHRSSATPASPRTCSSA